MQRNSEELKRSVRLNLDDSRRAAVPTHFKSSTEEAALGLRASPRSPDSWIPDDPNEGIDEQLGNAIHSKIASRLPPITLKSFDGDVKDWPLFLANFKSLVHDPLNGNAQRLVILTQCLSDRVQKGISRYLANPELYLNALCALKKRYGHPYLIAQSHLASLHRLPIVKENQPSSLIDFSAELSCAVGSLVAAGYEHELVSTDLLSRIVSKLPGRLRDGWGKVVFNLQPTAPTVLDLEN